MADTMVVYTHPECSYSGALKAELDDLGAEYQEIDLALKPEEWATLEALTGGERITPVSVEGDFVSIGFHGVG
ncbi:MAG: UXX-star (seleno)protein family 2 [SAR202 cluster bacterium]|nr:UXX-star (seleno)protein family 2 [SAR202 cluster bacterium]